MRPRMITLLSIVALSASAIFGLTTHAAAQDQPFDVLRFKVRATSGEPPYFPEVGLTPFEYSVELYCEYCVIVVGKFRMTGVYTGDMINRSCEATVPLSNGTSVRVVSTSGGHLQTYDGQTGALLVNFSASALRPPQDATARQLEEYFAFCVETGTLPQLY